MKNERGIALYLVLWVMALLTVIAGEFSYAVRTEANITRNFKEETQAYYIAASGVSWAIAGLVVNQFVRRPAPVSDGEESPDDIRARINTDIPAVPFGGGQFKVEKENESGKVNLNRANRTLLKMMLNTFELDEVGKDIIADAIMDWRDKDSLHRVNGAEDEYYLSLPLPYKCKNGDFTTTEELLLVRGVTPEIFHGGLKGMVSVYQDKETNTQTGFKTQTGARTQTGAKGKEGVDFNKININAAPPQMLSSLPGMTEELVLEIARYREKKDFRSLAELSSLVGSDIYRLISPYLTLKMSPYYTIRATGTLAEGRTRQGVQAVVKIDGKLEKGYETIQWIDNLEYR